MFYFLCLSLLCRDGHSGHTYVLSVCHFNHQSVLSIFWQPMISCITLKFCVSARQHFCLSVCLYLVPDNMHSQWSVVWFNSVSRTVCLLICLLKCLTVSLSICLCKVCLDVCLFAFLSLFCYWQTIYNLLVVSKYRVFIKYCVFF